VAELIAGTVPHAAELYIARVEQLCAALDVLRE
jgi:hypothetical protein